MIEALPTRTFPGGAALARPSPESLDPASGAGLVLVIIFNGFIEPSGYRIADTRIGAILLVSS
jgi:hypothetical protein